jgi:hypothetical protein
VILHLLRASIVLVVVVTALYPLTAPINDASTEPKRFEARQHQGVKVY